jgi:RimJ/RimL family protein N-acetyltransferase
MDLPTLRDHDLVLRPKVPSSYGRADGRQLGLTRLEILTHKDNLPSPRVAEEAGFHDTGRLASAPRSGGEEPVYAVYRLSAP